MFDRGTFTCDECSTEYLETGERDFTAARETMTAAGWRTFKGPDNQWAHACPSCVAEFARSKKR